MSKIEEKHRYKAKCYADMIIEKSATVSALTEKIGRYMADIQEYLQQLDKINVSPGEKAPVVEEPVIQEPAKSSPLLP